MLNHLMSLLFGDDDPAAAAAQGEPVRLAAAALLVEAAVMDGSMQRTEEELITTLLRQHFGLSATDAQALLDRAAGLQERSSQIFPFTKVIVDHCAEAQRIEMLEMLWEVAYADGRLHDYEANLVRRVSGLLYVSDQDSGAARQRAMARHGVSDDC